MHSLRPSSISTRPANVTSSRLAVPRPGVIARATSTNGSLAQFSNSIGLPTEDGVFGFTPFAEMWVGRWAQIGFASSIIGEFATGRGTLAQIGLPSPSQEVLIALCVLFGGATLVGTAKTIQRATGKKMSKNEINGYRTFLGLTKEDDYKSVAKEMKRKGDFATPGENEAAIMEARASGSPVDSFLSVNEMAEAQAVAQEMKSGATTASERSEETPAGPSPASIAAAQRQKQAEMASYAESMYFGAAGELAYARGIELTNGRYAMMGFLTAVLVEASTGQGILGQVIEICKWSGLLGDKSGF